MAHGLPFIITVPFFDSVFLSQLMNYIGLHQNFDRPLHAQNLNALWPSPNPPWTRPIFWPWCRRHTNAADSPSEKDRNAIKNSYFPQTNPPIAPKAWCVA